jgi:ABC-type transport system substrate-binding protein
VLSGWHNARVDQLLEEAKKTLDPARRKELYTEVWNINNVELAQFQLHEVTNTSAAVKEVQGYRPSAVGALTYQGGGVRTTYIKA